MSDYYHIKAIRMKITPEILQACEVGDADELSSKLRNFFDPTYIYNIHKKVGLDVTCTDKIYIDEDAYYLDYIFYNHSGDGEFTFSRMLTKNEWDIFKHIYESVPFLVKKDDLRRVEYCWYNCSEPPDCFEINIDDDSELLKSCIMEEE